MKKSFAVLLTTALILTGCSGSVTEKRVTARSPENAPVEVGKNEEQPDKTEVETEDPTEAMTPEDENPFPCSYTVPEGWVVAEEASTAEKIFFVKEGHENDEMPDNISIEIGKNRYKADEHERFRQAILQQLLMQLQGISAELNGDGSYTDQDYILYTFTIKQENMAFVQYYIVDDYRYCLIYLTNYTGEENADEAARALVDSFVWSDSEQ